jgi:chitodextrinase
MRRILILAAIASGTLAVGAGQAQAVIEEPIPADVGPGPPPIPELPPAGETPPPADAISDPITPDAECGDWNLQSNYGGRWPAGSTWWEYRCSYEYPQCTGQCNADWGPYVWTDNFYWDGSGAVFYGEFFGDFYFDSMWSASGCEYWWDELTSPSQWYILESSGCESSAPNAPPTAAFTSDCSGHTCSFDASGSADSDGTIQSYSWEFGDGTTASGTTAQHEYAKSGTFTATLTVTDNGGATDTESGTVNIENTAPTASFTSSCSGLSCSFDASDSSDSDGTIDSYSWNFGDGTAGGGKNAQHTYADGGTYEVKLVVTDNGGATVADLRSVTVIGLTAHGYKVKGLQKVNLSWSGPGGASFDIYRNGSRLPASPVQGTFYTDNIDRKGSGSYRYKVCEAGTSTCSDQATVTF